jgi:hypothetical protein
MLNNLKFHITLLSIWSYPKNCSGKNGSYLTSDSHLTKPKEDGKSLSSTMKHSHHPKEVKASPTGMANSLAVNAVPFDLQRMCSLFQESGAMKVAQVRHLIFPRRI